MLLDNPCEWIARHELTVENSELVRAVGIHEAIDTRFCRTVERFETRHAVGERARSECIHDREFGFGSRTSTMCLVSIIIGGVFNSGILVDHAVSPMFDYSPAAPDVIHRVERLKTVCNRHGVELAHAALAFPLREQAVATILLGARDRKELEQSLAMTPDDVPDELWTDLTNQGLIRELED